MECKIATVLQFHSIVLLSVLILHQSNVVSASNWLLESSFQAKPINMISAQVSSEKVAQSLGVNSTCQQQLDALLNQRPFQASWPMQMLDSNALLPSGVLRQTFTSVGSYKQCLQIHSHHLSTPVDGQFCFLTFSLPNTTTPDATEWERAWLDRTVRNNNRFRYAFSLCIPEVCSPEDLTLLFRNSSAVQKANLQNVRVSLCQSEKPQSFAETLREYNNNIVFSILVFALSFVVLGTVWHLLGFDPTHWLTFFSAIKNTKAIFSSTQAPEGSLEHRFQFLHGIRFWAMLWIFAAHAAVFLPAILAMPISSVNRHPYDINHLIAGNTVSGLLSNGFYAVQAFFLISGFLLTALMIEKNAAKQVATWQGFLSFVGLRWFRFSVPLLGVLVLQKTSFILWKGPFFTSEVANNVYERCNVEHWWRNFLFVENFVSRSCIRTSWFLSADLQIHIIAFVIVLALSRSSYRWVYRLSYFFASFSIVIPLILLLLGFPTMIMTAFFGNYDVKNLKTEMKWMYFMPYMHMGAYFFGAILGTLLMKNDKLFEKYLKPLFWVSFSAMLAAAFYKEPSIESLGHNHLHRGLINGVTFAFWILGLGMVVFQLGLPKVPKHAKWLSRFFSHPVNRPISRLSFSMYLTQYTTLILNFSLVEDVINISLLSSISFTLSSLIETFILSWILFIVFESPSYHFVKSFMSSKNSSQKKQKPVNPVNPEKNDLDFNYNYKQTATNHEQEMLDIDQQNFNQNYLKNTSGK